MHEEGRDGATTALASARASESIVLCAPIACLCVCVAVNDSQNVECNKQPESRSIYYITFIANVNFLLSLFSVFLHKLIVRSASECKNLNFG